MDRYGITHCKGRGMANMAKMVERVELVTSSGRQLLQLKGSKIAPTSKQFYPHVYLSLLAPTLCTLNTLPYICHTCADNNTTLHIKYV